MLQPLARLARAKGACGSRRLPRGAVAALPPPVDTGRRSRALQDVAVASRPTIASTGAFLRALRSRGLARGRGCFASARTPRYPLGAMEIEVLGCFGGESPEHRLTSLLINGRIVLDAGCLCSALPIERQVEIQTIVLSHSHADHTNSLPFFIDNVFGRNDRALDVYGSEPTVFAVRKHVFNSAVWPDFSRLPNHLIPSIRFAEFEDEQVVELDGIRMLPIPVNHVVPTHGFLVEDDVSAVLWSSDTGPTDRLWEVANRTPNLRAVCVDVSFDSSLQDIADASGHLTPQGLAAELEKLEQDVPVLVHHLKPACIEAIRRELQELQLGRVELLEQGRVYSYS